MNTSVVSPPQARARGIEFLPDAFVVHLDDGRSLTVPLEWFPRLRDATPEQRSHWRFIGPGTGIHWPDIDKEGMLRTLAWRRPPADSQVQQYLRYLAMLLIERLNAR